MVYQVKLDGFQGPLELLYQLVKKNKIEISNISLARISEQYFDYMNQLAEFNLDLASEFTVIAAELIEIKIKSLLPKNDSEETEAESEKTLVQRLKEYEYFKNAAYLFDKYQKTAGQKYTRPEDINFNVGEVEPELIIDADISDLVTAFKKALAANKSIKEETKQTEDLTWERYQASNMKIEDRVDYILTRIADSSQGVSFNDLISDCQHKIEIVVTFLSILELAKLCKVKVNQDQLFANINLMETG